MNIIVINKLLYNWSFSESTKIPAELVDLDEKKRMNQFINKFRDRY